jgi:hypothetical protein
LAVVHRPQRTAPYSSAPGKSEQGIQFITQ